jgi:hypothetical protein
MKGNLHVQFGKGRVSGKRIPWSSSTHKKREVFEYQVSKFADLTDRIIPFFNKYLILGQKSKDFEDFSKVADLMETKVHLTTEGVNVIRKIKDNMNTGRE